MTGLFVTWGTSLVTSYLSWKCLAISKNDLFWMIYGLDNNLKLLNYYY